jgi:hypothetical protein
MTRKNAEMTPYNRYFHRRDTEMPALYAAVREKEADIEKELEDARKICKHVDNGGMFEGACVKCGQLLG